ncbi:MAG: PspA/IM30 family protein [Candidatus Adiutrix sp.]|jgi:phage shock protein A|nr:PspA/IM30 family protein [Candidatus Adiutrix sp.]
MPSIFSRFADIISSNINAMLDKAENPNKMLKLIIAEMEDTLVEIKASCAQAMADQAKGARRLTEAAEKRDMWLKRAETAAAKGRDDLAKEALLEKRSAEENLAVLQEQANDLEAVVNRYRTEIDQLENKLHQAREKEQLLTHRENRAQKSIKASGQIKQYDLTEARIKLERLDSRMDRLEAEAELEFSGRGRSDAVKADEREKAFQELDDSLDVELRELKDRLTVK